MKCVFRFYLQLVSQTCLILIRTERDIIKKLYWSLCWSARYFCRVLMKLEFSRQIFEKYSNLKFHENPFSVNRVVPFGWKDRQNVEANSRFSQFCERALNMLYRWSRYIFRNCEVCLEAGGRHFTPLWNKVIRTVGEIRTTNSGRTQTSYAIRLLLYLPCSRTRWMKSYM